MSYVHSTLDRRTCDWRLLFESVFRLCVIENFPIQNVTWRELKPVVKFINADIKLETYMRIQTRFNNMVRLKHTKRQPSVGLFLQKFLNYVYEFDNDYERVKVADSTVVEFKLNSHFKSRPIFQVFTESSFNIFLHNAGANVFETLKKTKNTHRRIANANRRQRENASSAGTSFSEETLPMQASA